MIPAHPWSEMLLWLSHRSIWKVVNGRNLSQFVYMLLPVSNHSAYYTCLFPIIIIVPGVASMAILPWSVPIWDERSFRLEHYYAFFFRCYDTHNTLYASILCALPLWNKHIAVALTRHSKQCCWPMIQWWMCATLCVGPFGRERI